MSSRSASFLEALVRTSIHPVLKVQGFRRKGRTWNRLADDVIQVIDIQASQWNEGDSGRFTVNLGIFSQAVYEIVWGREPPSFVKVSDCMISCRIGTLIDCADPKEASLKSEQREKWWTFDQATNLDELGKEVIELIVRCGLEVLNVYGSVGKAKQLLRRYSGSREATPWDHINLAIIDAQQGNKIAAKERLTWVSSHYDAYRERVQQIANRLDI